LAFDLTGGKDLEEIELTHLDGHKGSKPVRIGNGAADHVQLVGSRVSSFRLPIDISIAQDIYGELYVLNRYVFGFPFMTLVLVAWIVSTLAKRCDIPRHFAC
jgi:hypothetical protein